MDKFIKLLINLYLIKILRCQRILAISQSHGRNIFNQDYKQRLKSKSNKLNTIVNILFIPFLILVLGYCLFKILKKKIRERKEREAIQNALKNIETGIIMCQNKHKINSRSSLIKKLFRKRILEALTIIFCNSCNDYFPTIKRIHQCVEFCNFNLCRSCYIRARNIQKNIKLGVNYYDKPLKRKLRTFGQKRKGQKKIYSMMRFQLRKQIVKKFKNILVQDKKSKYFSDDSEWEFVENSETNIPQQNEFKIIEQESSHLDTSREDHYSKYSKSQKRSSVRSRDSKYSIRLSRVDITIKRKEQSKQFLKNSKKRYSINKKKMNYKNVIFPMNRNKKFKEDDFAIK